MGLFMDIFRPVFLISTLTLLTACGGGGGGGGGGDNPAPTLTCASDTALGDPLYADQWHLNNTGSPTGTSDEDTNVESVPNTICGNGITISVVDDGLEIAHEDLAANVVSGSKNYVNNSTDPTPAAGSTDSHGTSVAGIAAAVGFNGIGVRGVAHGAQLIGFNYLATAEETDLADALVRGDISNNSHGPDDNGQLYPASAIFKAAIDDGITNRRDGKGIIYFIAGGNGRGEKARNSDYSNYDGNASYHGVNAIAALNDNGKQASYSESGANILISAHAGERCDTNTQTTVDASGTAGANNAGNNDGEDDYSNDNYTKCFNGTSGAAPIASGVAALVLQENPNLSRRDMRLLLGQTARKNDPEDSDWTINGAGMPINHKYGFGAIDAAAAVAAASNWAHLAPQKVPEVFSSGDIAVVIPDSPGENVYGAAITSTINIAASSISLIEFVEVTFASDHPFFNDLEIILTSPNGTKSVLAETHFQTSSGDAINGGASFESGFTFGSIRHTDEAVGGDWVIAVRDGGPGDVGNITSWSIKLFGR
jgi:kexin